MSEIELELTYLAKEIPKEINGVEPKELVDIYIPDHGVEHPELRLRKKGNTYEMTKKVPVEGEDYSMHHEHTIPLNKQEYEALKNSSNKTVQKDRYEVAINGYRAEVDVFKGLLKGLVLIDFEFDSVEERDAFVAPPVCLVEVTQEEFIAGGLLGGKSYKEIEPKLVTLGYKPIN